jgi:hypothetical protein
MPRASRKDRRLIRAPHGIGTKARAPPTAERPANGISTPIKKINADLERVGEPALSPRK